MSLRKRGRESIFGRKREKDIRGSDVLVFLKRSMLFSLIEQDTKIIYDDGKYCGILPESKETGGEEEDTIICF